VSSAFATATAGGSNDTVDPTFAVTLQNIGNEPLHLKNILYPADFSARSSTCTANHTIPAGGSCVTNIQFSPVTVSGTKTQIALSEGVKVETDSLNEDTTTLLATLSGTETKLTPTSLALSVEPADADTGVLPGTPLTLTVQAAGSANPPSGTVQLLSGGVPIGTATLSSGKAVVQKASLPAGTHTLAALYEGNAVYTTAVSNAAKVVLNRFPGTVTLTASPSSAAAGAPVVFKAVVPQAARNYIPEGTAKFYDGTTLVGTEPLSAGSQGLA
jgi:hypothetical protein